MGKYRESNSKNGGYSAHITDKNLVKLIKFIAKKKDITVQQYIDEALAKSVKKRF